METRQRTLSEIRNSKGYSQEELARKMDVSVFTVSRWENNPGDIQRMQAKNILKLAQVLGVSVEELL